MHLSLPIRIAALLTWLLLAAAGLVGLWFRLTTGHEFAAYGNNIPWGLWVVAYVYFSGMSAGFLMLSAMATHSGHPAVARFGPLGLFAAATTLCMGLVSIAMDLGHMNRSVDVMLHANVKSIMAWMIFLYSIDFTLVIIENILALGPHVLCPTSRKGLRDRIVCLIFRVIPRIPQDFADRWLHRLGYAEIPLAVTFFGGVGALFGTISARDYWHHPLIPILFVVGALLSAVGAFAVLAWLLVPHDDPGFGQVMRALGVILLALLVGHSLMEVSQILIPLWQGLQEDAAPFRALLFGPFGWVFWIVHVLVGTLVPIGLLWFARRRASVVALAGALSSVTFFFVRFGQIVPPQTQELFPGQTDVLMSARNSLFYFPNLYEWSIVAGVLAMGGALLWLGVKLLPVLPLPTSSDDESETELELDAETAA